jgi:hypothetical protein
MKYSTFQRALLTFALCTCSLSYAGQTPYVWFDEKGIKQYSDMPPPVSVPTSRILKHPGASSPAAPTAAEADTTPATASATAAEKNAEFRKRKLEQAEKEKKATEETKLAADKTRYCERAQEYSKALDSGERISRTDKNGERSFLTDEQRAHEQRDTRRMLEDCK